MTVPQHAAYFGQSGAVSEHVSGQRMPELVGTSVPGFNASAPDRRADNRGDSLLCAKGADWCKSA